MLHTFKLINRGGRVARRAGLITTVALIIAGLSLVALKPRTAYGLPQDYAQKLNRFVQQSGATPAMRVFAEGRDFLDSGDWAKAAEKFQSFVVSFPKDKDMDAAYFWLAYSFNKQGRKQEAASWLDKLFKEFPKSTWKDDAKALAVEMGDPQAVKRGIEGDDNDEIKLIALQSLFDNNPERAIQYVNEMLKSPSTTPEMKEAVVSILGAHGGRQAVPLLLQLARTDASSRIRQTAIHRLGEEGGESVIDDLRGIYQADRDVQVKEQVLHALSEMDSPRAKALLLDVARNAGENLQMRAMAIHWLGERNDATADELMQIYNADRTREIREQILHAFSEMDDPAAAQKLLEAARTGDDVALRANAIHWLGEKNSEAVVDELMRMFDTEQSRELKMQIIHAFAEMNNARARAKLMDVARGGTDLELRAYAIRRLADDGDSPQTVQMLASLYDTEKNLEVKGSILHALSDSQQKGALQKLMEVARRDQSVELRKLAIRLIGESRDPEALKFLEELLKQP
jgi:HEAT repeat protein